MSVISVIIPVYNAEKYLNRCLESVLKQTFHDFEVICVDDGSKDNSLKILKQIAKQDDRVSVISQKNGGAAAARNRGLQNAKGQWFCFVDADDAVHPMFLDICLHFASLYKTDLVCFRFSRSDGGDYPTGYINADKIRFKLTDYPLKSAMSKGNFRIPFSVCTKFYKKSLFENIRFIEGNMYEDCAHTYAVLKKHPRTIILDQKLYFYTRNMDSVSNTKMTTKQLEHYHALMLYLDNLYADTPSKDYKIIFRELYPRLIRNQYKCCRKASVDIQNEMFKLFCAYLREYRLKKMMRASGIGLIKYMRYLWLMKKY